MVLFYLGELFSLSYWWAFQQDANGVEKEEGNAWPVRSDYFTLVTKKAKERTVSSISALRLCTS